MTWHHLDHLLLVIDRTESIGARARDLAKGAAVDCPDNYHLPSLLDELSALREAVLEVRRAVVEILPPKKFQGVSP